MALIAIRQKLTREQADSVIKQVEDWFKANPRRRVCYTQYHKLRKGKVREDIYKAEGLA